MPTPAAIDLFCGAGGLSYGLKLAGIRILAGFDIDPACRHPFEENVGAQFYEQDVASLSVDLVEHLFAQAPIKILAGCAPCQPFSTYTNGKTVRPHEWGLLRRFGEIVDKLRPEVVTIENVPRLRKQVVFKDLVSTLQDNQYRFSHSVIRCADYGVPQTRRRLVLLASRFGNIELIPPTHDNSLDLTVRNAIQHLEPIEAGAYSLEDPLHKSSRLAAINLERIRNSAPGGTWRDWDTDLKALCHLKRSGHSFPSVYGRMQWDALAPTITTQFHAYGSGRFGHPSQDRAISLREGAMLQTFPEDYSFTSSDEVTHISSIARLIGNAVPVCLGEAIGRSILAHTERYA